MDDLHHEAHQVSNDRVTPRDLWMARRKLAPLVRRTPLIPAAWLSERVGRSVYLKLENLQQTGSFKVRGAANRMLELAPQEKERGVVAFSTGNHGRAVAYVAKQLGIKAVVCLSKRVPVYRVDAIRHLGAEVVLVGGSQDEAEEYALELQRQHRMTIINPFDDPLVIAGQGTIGIELLEDLPELDTVIVPVSGGGLISGIALALKAADPKIKVFGVSMERAPVMYHSLQAGAPIRMEEQATIADALMGGIGLDNRLTFPMIRELVDDLVLVSEGEIRAAIATALVHEHLVVEGAAAVGIAALISAKVRQVGQSIAVLVSGGNCDAGLLLQVVQALSAGQIGD
jgi:threonine dehydratase